MPKKKPLETANEESSVSWKKLAPDIGYLRITEFSTLIGRKTAGAMLSSTYIKVAGDWELHFPLADYRTPQGKKIEGVGVEPNIKVEKVSGKDLDTELALEFLKN